MESMTGRRARLAAKLLTRRLIVRSLSALDALGANNLSQSIMNLLLIIPPSFAHRVLHQGRKGLGNIYVWASGDGGEEDDCNCDGYAASMWTISINSAINDGQNAHYDESCSSTLASTFSNGAKDPNTGVVIGRILARGRSSV